ncbi:MAG: YeeE/YedE thiosulfate transporter family protein [Candidatus Auribacterota bacterium]|nr:YeeE/YedE thiosulfate transporter family protein [Candidatus Auribacterota bacterium]
MKKLLYRPLIMVAGFALLNVIMYLTIHKFWIGGSSFLPMVGKLGPGNKLIFAFIVNMGVIVGSFVGAFTSGEFRFRLPRTESIARGILGGILIGIGITLAPGTRTTAFVIGLPMLSISSVLSIAGMFAGGFIMYSMTMGKCSVKQKKEII